jgi:hypothetical protein
MNDPNQFQPPPPPPAKPAQAARPAKLFGAGISIFVLGVVLLLAGIVKILPGGVGTGIAFAFWGLVLFVKSFIRLPLVTDKDEPAMSGLQKLTSIFYEPSRVFKNLRVHPNWLAAFLVIVAANAIYNAAFVHRLTAERIVDYTFEKMESSPIKPPPDQMATAKEQALQANKQPVHLVQTAAKTFVSAFVLVAFIALLCFLGVLVFGGNINYWQSFAAVMYSYLPVAVIQKLVSLIILYVKAPEDVHPILGAQTLLQDNLGVLFLPAEHPALYVLGSAIGVLSLYGLWLKAKGLANAGTKVSSGAAWGVSITLWVLGLGLGMILAVMFSGFMS